MQPPKKTVSKKKFKPKPKKRSKKNRGLTMKQKEKIAVDLNKLETQGARNVSGRDFVKTLTKEEFKIFNFMRAAPPTKGELEVMRVLEQNNIKYFRNQAVRLRAEDRKLRVLYFDFYLYQYNLFIEFDGEYHSIPIRGEDILKRQKLYDFYKDRHCRKHKVNLLRIPYTEINNIESILCKYFDELKPIPVKEN